MITIPPVIDALREKLDRAIKYRAISLQIAVEDIQSVLGHIQTVEDLYRKELFTPNHNLPRTNIQHYVLGLLFRSCYSGVVLIEKTKPEWQAGCLNGIGGKIEPGENARVAMVREYKEETGVDTDNLQWIPFCEMSGDQFVVECFTSIDTESFECSTTNEEERIIKVDPVNFPNAYKCVPHLQWLIKMAMDVHTGDRFFSTVRYSEPFRIL